MDIPCHADGMDGERICREREHVEFGLGLGFSDPRSGPENTTGVGGNRVRSQVRFVCDALEGRGPRGCHRGALELHRLQAASEAPQPCRRETRNTGVEDRVDRRGLEIAAPELLTTLRWSAERNGTMLRTFLRGYLGRCFVAKN